MNSSKPAFVKENMSLSFLASIVVIAQAQPQSFELKITQFRNLPRGNVACFIQVIENKVTAYSGSCSEFPQRYCIGPFLDTLRDIKINRSTVVYGGGPIPPLVISPWVNDDALRRRICSNFVIQK